MKKIILFALSFSCLGACVTTQNQTEPDTPRVQSVSWQRTRYPRSVDQSIKGLEGCTKDFAFEVLGLPTGERTIDGKKYFEWELRKRSCVIDALVSKRGIIDHIYYNDIKNQCVHMYTRIIRYYRTHPAQNKDTCPNRTDFQGNPNIK